MKVTLESFLQRRVQRGAMYLDITLPGWYKKIDLVRFDIHNTCDCICGQLLKLKSDEFFNKFKELFPSVAEFGIGLMHNEFDNEKTNHLLMITLINRRYKIILKESKILDILQAFWRKEISQRLRLDYEQKINIENCGSRVVQQFKQNQELIYS